MCGVTTWTDDEIVARIREYAAEKQLPPPAPAEAADALEAAVGYPMPPLLRRLYCEVANGGFGVGGEVLALVDTGHDWFSDEESLSYLQPGVAASSNPSHVLPLVTLGCAIWWHVDFSTPEGRMWGWDPHILCKQDRLFPERFTLAEWLTDWLQGNRTFPKPPETAGCPDC